MKSLFLALIALIQDAFQQAGWKYLANEVGQIGYSKRTVIDIESGKVLEKEIVPYSGPFAQAMPNSRPKAMKNWAALQQSITPMIPGEGERIPWTWYHRVPYVDNVTTQLTFFNATGVLTTTNMQAAGQIPAPMFFDVYHIGVWFDFMAFATQYTDLTGLIDSIVSFQVAQKVYWQGPTWMLPPGGGVDGQTAIATDQTARNGVADLRNRYSFWGDITIPHNQFFSVVIDWAAAVNIAANVDIIVAMDGYLYRRVL